MCAIRNLGLCNLSRAACCGGLLLSIAAYMLLSAGERLSSGWAQEPGKLTSRATSAAGGKLAEPREALGGGGSASDSRTDQLLREGAKIVNQSVNCRATGERLVVELPQSSQPLLALENLAAQRILKALQDDIGSERWSINGSITEFQGRNYILLDRVTRESKR